MDAQAVACSKESESQHGGVERREQEDEEGADYERAVEAAGYGKFHWWLMFVCGWANASDAVEILCISFLLPSAECDLDLDSERKGWLSGVLFIGMAVGGYVWGSLGDSIGRKRCLVSAMFVNASAVFVSSFSQTYQFFITLRFLSGVGVGGSIPVVWTYFAEFQPAKWRGAALSVIATFWMVGNVVVAALAWAIIPRIISWQLGSLEYNSWRIFVAVCALPSFLVAIGLLFLPESPKFYLSKGQEQKALQIFRNMYASNTGQPKYSYPVIKFSKEALSAYSSQTKPVKEVLKETLANTAHLFRPSLFKITIIMLIINFTIQFGYYGLFLWLPELFNKLETYYNVYPNATVSVCEVVGVSLNSTTSIPCEDRPPPEDQVFINSFIISIAAAPGNAWTILMMDRLGRKFFLVFSMGLSGASAFFIYLVKSPTMNLVLSCVFGLVSTMGFNALDCLGIELFPTEVRGTAMAITLAAARIGALLGNVVFGYLVEVHCAVPIIMVAALLIGGGALGIFLPSTTRTPLL